MNTILDTKEWGLQTCDDKDQLIFPDPGNFHSKRFYEANGCAVLKIDTGCQHTGGSEYPRTELKQKAVWDSKSAQQMRFSVAVLQLPKKKPEVCFAQIKTGNAEMQLLLHGHELICRHFDKKHTPMGHYQLGDWVDVEVQSTHGIVYVKIGGSTCSFKADFNGASFKCGAYMQSNAAIEGNKATECEVHLKNLVLNK